MVGKHDRMGIQALKEQQQGTVPETEARPTPGALRRSENVL